MRSERGVIVYFIYPEKVVDGYYGRKIAQGLLSENLILRVVYEEKERELMVVTVYPGERRRYE